MNVRFGKLHAENFLSFEEVDFDFSSFGDKTILISGVNRDIPNSDGQSNGSGKSTIFQALIFAVYGETLSDGKSAHIRNWNCGTKDRVVVTLGVETNGRNYVIVRTLSGKKANSELHVFVKADDGTEDEITRSTIAETQKMIETDVVPCGKEGFLRCVVLTADQNYNFFKLNKSSKNEFFESLFELTAFTEAYNKLHRKTLDDGNTLIAESRTIDQLKDSIAKLERDREEAKKNQSDVIEAEKSLADAKSRLSDFENGVSIEERIASIENEARRMAEAKNAEKESKLREYDSSFSISFDGNDVVFPKSVEDSVANGLAEFDRENGIESIDSEGKIVFGESEEQKRIVAEGKELGTRIENGEELVNKLFGENEKLSKRRADIDFKIRSNKSSIEDAERRLSSHSSITDILCDKCVSKYRKSVSIDGLDKEIERMETENAELEKEGEALLEEIGKRIPTMDKYKQAIASMTAKRDELRAEYSSIVSSRKLLQSERNLRMRTLVADVEEKKRRIVDGRAEIVKSFDSETNAIFDKARNDVERVRNEHEIELKRLSSDVSNAEYRLKVVSESKTKSFDAPIASLNESLAESRRRYREIDKAVAHEKALESVLKPEAIRKSVVADMLKELNFRICGYLSKMGSNYTCRFNEDFEATFTSSKGVETEYGFFSAGERMRLSIACCFAFKDFMQVRLNIRSNILAIDEYIDSNLDANAVNGIMELIRFMVASENMTAFIISHRSEIKNGMFDGEVVVTKENDSSKIEIRD